MPFQQRTNTSCYLAIPTHGFTVVLSVFWGTPPTKPLKCKSVSIRLGARFRQRWTESTGGKPRLSCASIRLVLPDIIKTSFSFFSQCAAFRYHVSLLFRFCMGKQKTLLPFRQAGCRNPLSGSFTCSPSIYPNRFGAPARNMTWIGRG
jgi:hypothetical protein